MPRSKNAVASRARRRKVLKMAKGYFGSRKNVWTVAKNSVEKALCYAYIGRKLRKRDFRSLLVSTPVLVSTECHTAHSWVKFTHTELN
jgi:large subunit ribosomal protein L20